jgi:hypothetical protein
LATKKDPEKISGSFFLVLVRYELEVSCLAYAIQAHSALIGMDLEIHATHVSATGHWCSLFWLVSNDSLSG